MVGGGGDGVAVGWCFSTAARGAEVRARVGYFFSSRRRHTRLQGDWSSDVCSSDLKEREFIEAARAAGVGHGRILFHHILPHLVPLMIVYATLGIATNVLFEAALSFLDRKSVV